MTNGNGRARQVLRELPSWRVTQIPRRPHCCAWLCQEVNDAGRPARTWA